MIPRCKKGKKERKRNMEERVLAKVRNKVMRDVDACYVETAADMSRTCGAIYHYALGRAFGFTIDDDVKLQEEIAKISEEIKRGDISVDEIEKEQMAKGFEFV